MIPVTPPALAWIEFYVHDIAVCAIWRREPGTPIPARSWGRIAAAGDFVAADAADDQTRLACADVICDSGSASRAVPVQWLSRTMRAFPGCAVSAIWNGPGLCAMATRQDRIEVSVSGASGLCAGWQLLASAAMVHGWLSARLPVASLAPGNVELRVGSGSLSSSVPGTNSMPIPFTMLAVDPPWTRHAG